MIQVIYKICPEENITGRIENPAQNRDDGLIDIGLTQANNEA
jgi:hypothetical protein